MTLGAVKQQAVRFLRPWQGWVPGQKTRQLMMGVAEQLVRRGIAEWCAWPRNQAEVDRTQIPAGEAGLPVV